MNLPQGLHLSVDSGTPQPQSFAASWRGGSSGGSCPQLESFLRRSQTTYVLGANCAGLRGFVSVLAHDHHREITSG